MKDMSIMDMDKPVTKREFRRLEKKVDELAKLIDLDTTLTPDEEKLLKKVEHDIKHNKKNFISVDEL